MDMDIVDVHFACTMDWLHRLLQYPGRFKE
jgi:hypothetical protein